MKSALERFNEGTERHLTGVNHQRYLAGIYCVIGSFLCLIFCINALIDSKFYLAAVLFVVSIFLFISYLIFHSKTHFYLHDTVRHITLLGLFFLGGYLIYTGGVNNSGPLWVFIIPPVALAFCGLKIGMLYNVTFLIVICIFLFYPDDVLLAADYTYEFKTRFIYSFLTTLALSSFYEAARYKSFSQLNKLTEKYKLESKLDDLTGLLNRRGMWKKLNSEYDLVTSSGSTMTVALWDIDHFKNVNDIHGHGVGDDVLKHVSDLANKIIRSQDSVSRWGGEEFLLLMPETNEAEAIDQVKYVCSLMAKRPFILDKNTSITVTFSVGICEVSLDIDTERAIMLSDKCLYHAKRTGRNKVVAFSELNED
ncbi:GGDEF domain-containing protein [Marinomonas sp. 15G1-11]|uniref:diguanylate cyclase n=1 Tax=Marinomonas phaeophyticola TaxID=3004091 RepID=A0ABT4JTW1_9GAMM|nr:GGDEF domain-containing protein [Marinomonas sp. 15G1-11]MCZ2721774.1 GGDEF domain-containing protein [Marinomonas sp. 15G1-11]